MPLGAANMTLRSFLSGGTYHTLLGESRTECARTGETEILMAYNKLRVAKIVQETPDARSFILEIPTDLADKYKYRAGQFLTFRVPHPGGAFNRCYSLSSAPEIDGQPKVTVKRVVGGKGSNWFHDALKEGQELEVLP